MDEVFDRLQSAAEVMIELRQFLLYRLAVYAAFGGIMVAYWIGVLMIGWLVSKLIPPIAPLFVIVGIFGNFGLVYVARSFLLYTVQAGYIAVLTQTLFGGLPPGTDQKNFAKEAVTARFRDVAVLAAADQLVRGVVKGFNRALEDMASWVPIPGMHQLLALVNAVIALAVGTINEAILSLSFLRKDQPLWDTVREGVVLYAGAWQPILKLSAALVVLDWLCTGMLFVMLLVLMGLPAATIFSNWAILRWMGIILPVLTAYLIRQTLFQPLGVTVIVIAFHRAIKGQTPDPALEEKLTAVSPHFAQIVAKAQNPEAAAPAAPAAAAPAAGAAPGATARPRQRPLKKP